MEYKGRYSPFSVKLDRENKVITINYNEHILKEPGVAKNLDSIKERLIPIIEDSFKNQV